ncbi:MAG: sigma-70 family RNA polymerase sigma factor [Bryobacteraceae bacterium]
MNAAASQEITTLLKAWGSGERSALDRLVPLVYRELRRMARQYMRRSDSGTMQATALVHETYLRLVDLTSVEWQDRAHFYAVSARVMRGILVDAARARQAQKRGGLLQRANPGAGFDVDQVPDLGSQRAAEILAINDALDHLAQVNPRQMHVVEMRFFGGLSVEETAEVLKISLQSVKRDWSLAKAWLRREMRRSPLGVKDHGSDFR